MKKILSVIFLIIVLGLILILANSGAPDEGSRAQINEVNESNTISTEITDSETIDKIRNYDISKLSFEYTGYGPGKSHTGSFDNISLVNIPTENSYNGMTIEFSLDSITVEPEALRNHLCAEEFFNCDTENAISFTLREIKILDETNLEVAGDLSIKGTTKSITFPVQKEEGVVQADFFVDMSQFNWGIPNIVDNEVRIIFSTEF